MSYALFLAIAAAALGLALGSAATALAYRVPLGKSWVRGRSACTSCGHRLGPADLVPLFSWLASLGRCRHCGARIPVRYPLTEVWCAAWSVLLIARVGVSLAYPLLLVWGVLLVALFWIDLEHQLLPDALTLPGTLVGAAAAVLDGPGARHALFGIVAGSGILWLLALAWIHIRKVEGMGGGDVKLAAMFGAVLGWPLTLLTLFLAALVGSAWGGVLMLRGQGSGRTALPFGTLLAPAAMVAWLWGRPLLEAYARLVAW